MTNIRQLMKQAQQMQERMQRELAEMVVEASVGGGMVTVKMSGHKQLVAVKIDPEIMDPEDPRMLEDLVLAAVNEAAARSTRRCRRRWAAWPAACPACSERF